ncbi:MAG TPA: PhoPQ-activated protein PqaA family protein, partial [Gammaproteobacteria bacterium]
GEPLRQIIDPYRYRAHLTQPKLVMLATNDEYFPLDSANLYWDELEEPKRLLYLPNQPHGIDDVEPVVRGLRALHAAAGDGKPLPQLDWEYRWGDTVTLCIHSDEARLLRVWQAVSPGRDFRAAVWQPAAISKRSSGRFEIAHPAGGYVAVFGEATFGRGRAAFMLSTNVAIIAAPPEPAYGTEPRGTPGICEALGVDGPVAVR